MEQNKTARKAKLIRLTTAEIKKLPIEMQHEIKGAVHVLRIQKNGRRQKRP